MLTNSLFRFSEAIDEHSAFENNLLARISCLQDMSKVETILDEDLRCTVKFSHIGCAAVIKKVVELSPGVDVEALELKLSIRNLLRKGLLVF